MVTFQPFSGTYLFRGAQLFGSSWALLPKVSGDGEGVNAHGHSFGRDGSELLTVRAVLVNGLYHLGRDDSGPDASKAYHLLSFRVHSVNRSELAAGVSEEDEEVIGCALLHLLKRRRTNKKQLLFKTSYQTSYLNCNARGQFTSTILFFCGSLTLPARQQRVIALWMMNLLDLKLGSLYSFGPARHDISRCYKPN